uniref:Uncharacterized protein n=1 Tax=Plectus sambesii TaxID=2011161 RepID=A0A914WUL6_9BILA
MSAITCMSVYTERSATDLVAFAYCPASMGVRPPTRNLTTAPLDALSTLSRRPLVDGPSSSRRPLRRNPFPAQRTAVSARRRRPLFVASFLATSPSIRARP